FTNEASNFNPWTQSTAYQIRPSYSRRFATGTGRVLILPQSTDGTSPRSIQVPSPTEGDPASPEHTPPFGSSIATPWLRVDRHPYREPRPIARATEQPAARRRETRASYPRRLARNSIRPQIPWDRGRALPPE